MIQIAGYDSFEILGRGGFAVVYKARQISIGREVAIKVLSDPMPDADLIRRFERESKAVGALSWHPNIAAVVDAGTTDQGQGYIVFELISGGSLDDRLASGPLSWVEALPAMIQVADATEAAHREHMLHRDIKPANILKSRIGDAKLADFGIASMQDGTKTETGMFATTVAHAAPELFDGAPSSRATDVYALGSTLHNLVTGRPPFTPTDGERIATTIKRIATEPPPRPDPATVPRQVAAVIAHALAKQPEFRPRSAVAFGKALQQVQRDHGLTVTPMSVGDKEPDEPDDNMIGRPESPQSHDVAATRPAVSGRTSSRTTDSSATDSSATNSGRLVGTLLALVVLLGAAIGGALLFNAQSSTDEPLVVTSGGATIVDISALADTAIVDLPAANAIDLNSATYWGVQPNITAERNIAGTTFVLRFDEPIDIASVGIDNGSSGDLSRVSHVTWGTSVDDLRDRAVTNVTQEIPDEAGEHRVAMSITTDQLALVIADVHDIEAPSVGIAEILVDVG
jgi:serine/threonine protein kinase